LIKTGQIQIVLTWGAIVAMLSGGVFGVMWTFPNDQGGIVNAVLSGETESASYLGPKGNGTLIRPGSEGQFIMFYQTRIQAGMGAGTYLVPSGEGFAFGHFLWTTPSSTLSSFEVRYAIFTFEFSSQLGPPSPLWFTGPQGDLTALSYGIKYGGLENTRPGSLFQTRIIEVSGSGNYTLHYFNRGAQNATGIVAMYGS